MQRRQLFHLTAAMTLAMFVLTACASFQLPMRAAYHPTKAKAAQDADHNECLAFAKERTGYDPATSAVAGGAIGGAISGAAGAAVGAIIGSVLGDTGSGAALGAALGIPGGVSAGATEMQRMHDLFTKQYSVCMRAKGYLVE